MLWELKSMLIYNCNPLKINEALQSVKKYNRPTDKRRHAFAFLGCQSNCIYFYNSLHKVVSKQLHGKYIAKSIIETQI